MSHIFGAALYVPANHPDLALILKSEKLSTARTIIVCLEDSIAPHDYIEAIRNLTESIGRYLPNNKQAVFLRPRNVDCLHDIMALDNAAECFKGAVLPKFDCDSLTMWAKGISQLDIHSQFSLMPTLETVSVFNPQAMRELVAMLSDSILTPYVKSLRIGGNDLFSLLKMRRPRERTIYETPLGAVIAQLVTTFIPNGFELSAPVFEYLDDEKTMTEEVKMDIDYGLTGKTAIHPKQIKIIESHFRVTQAEVESAQAILATDAAGVFKLHGAMCEPETHRNWAKRVIICAERYGVMEI